jgi:hypothetical protein
MMMGDTLTELFDTLNKEVENAVRSEVSPDVLRATATEWVRKVSNQKNEELLFKFCSQEDEQIKVIIEEAVRESTMIHLGREIEDAINHVVGKRLLEITKKRKKKLDQILEEMITVEMVENYFPRVIELTHSKVDEIAHRRLLKHCIKAIATARINAIVKRAAEVGVKLGRTQSKNLQHAIETELHNTTRWRGL